MSAELRGLLFEFLASEKMNEKMNVFAAATAAAAKGLSGATHKKTWCGNSILAPLDII